MVHTCGPYNASTLMAPSWKEERSVLIAAAMLLLESSELLKKLASCKHQGAKKWSVQCSLIDLTRKALMPSMAY